MGPTFLIDQNQDIYDIMFVLFENFTIRMYGHYFGFVLWGYLFTWNFNCKGNYTSKQDARVREPGLL